jgi:serine/threonine protein phosphatase PrpC
VVSALGAPSLFAPHAPDRVDVGERGVLLAVSDGMGGVDAGDAASHLVLEHVRRSLGHISLRASGVEALRVATEGAHDALREWSRRKGLGPTRAGATLTAVHVRKSDALIAHVGDSRAYVIRAGRILRLTQDQTMVQALMDGGFFGELEMRTSPLRNVLLQTMGHERAIDVTVSRLALRDRDCLLLCSNGLTEVVTDAEIAALVLGSVSLELAAARMVDLANGRGAPDNVTVMIAGVAGDLPLPQVSESIESTLDVSVSAGVRSERGVRGQS